LRSRLYALGEVGELPRVLPLLAEPLRTEMMAKAAESPDGLQEFVLTGLGMGYGQTVADGPIYQTYFAGRPEPLALDGFDVALPERAVFAVTGNNSPSVPAPVTLSLSGEDLVLRVGQQTDRVALGTALASIPQSVFTGAAEEVSPLTVDLVSASGRRVRARISYAVLEGANRIPSQLTLTLLLRRADWPSLRSD
jgi:hypothetical protein